MKKVLTILLSKTQKWWLGTNMTVKLLTRMFNHRINKQLIEINDTPFGFYQISTQISLRHLQKQSFTTSRYENITRINRLHRHPYLLSSTVYGRPQLRILSPGDHQGQLNMVLQHCQDRLPSARCSAPSSWLCIAIWLPVKEKNSLLDKVSNFVTFKEYMYTYCYYIKLSNEPHHEKTGFLPMRKQRRRSASQ